MPVLKWILGLCVCLFMVSCTESDKERLNRLVKEWEGKEILFPAHSTFTVQGKDTVDFEFRNADYKIEVAMANVEALAADEDNGSCTKVCYECNGWICTRIYDSETSRCIHHRKL